MYGGIPYASDIDFDEGTVKISRNVQYSSDTGIYVTSTKTGENRTLDIGTDTINLLREWRQEQSNTCITPYVFNQQ